MFNITYIFLSCTVLQILSYHHIFFSLLVLSFQDFHDVYFFIDSSLRAALLTIAPFYGIVCIDSAMNFYRLHLNVYSHRVVIECNECNVSNFKRTDKPETLINSHFYLNMQIKQIYKISSPNYAQNVIINNK